MQAVIYAKNAAHLARFYEQVLGLTPLEAGAGFVHLHAEGIELTVVAMPPHLAATVELQEPPLAREDTPIKLSFRVDCLQASAPLVSQCGGRMQAPESAWVWREQRHLDGLDPEGNVFQLRENIRFE